MNRIDRLIIKFQSFFIPDGPHGDRRRGKLYEPYLKKCGVNFKLASQAFIFNPGGLAVGNDVYIGFNSYIGQGEVEIEDQVLIGNFVSITATNHLCKNGSFRFGGYESKCVKIGRGTWIGANACVLAGVNIGKSCLIAAGCVVTKDIPDYTIWGGVPGKKIGEITDK